MRRACLFWMTILAADGIAVWTIIDLIHRHGGL